MDESYNRKWQYLQSYGTQRTRLKRLLWQREELIALRGKTNDLGTVIQTGHTSDMTCDSALKLLDNTDKIEQKIAEIFSLLASITQYIDESPITEIEKLILTCRFIKGMKSSEISAEVGYEGANGAMHKRIRRIVRKLPEPTIKKWH